MDAANIEPGAPFEFADRILSVPAVASSFESFLLAADRGAPLDGTLARLAFVATSPDKESADAALAHAQRLLRKVRRRRSQWLEDGDGLFRVWFDSVHEDGSHGRATASVLPALLPPPNRRDASHLKFIANAVADAAAMIARRNVALSGPPLLIAAACFSDPQDSGSHAGSTPAARPVVVKKGEAPELLDLFRKLSQREAAEAAAAAAAARFGAADGGAGGPDQTPEEAEEAELGVAALSLGAIENCAADMDARDWQTIIGRLESWTRTRVLHAETAAEETASIAASVCDEESGKDGPVPVVERAPVGWKIAAEAARILLRIDALPVAVATPDPSKPGDRGDIVAYSVNGPDAGAVARQLSSADWPTARGDVHASLARIALAAGAQLHCCNAVRDEDAAVGASMIAAWWRIRSVEAPLWVYLATLWSSSSGQSAVAATNAFREMDHWSQDAGCGTIPSLYALMLSSNDRSLVVDGFDEDVAESLTRASYALLSTPALLKPAVIGLDANIDDVALIEEAVDKAEDEGDAPDGDAPDGESEDAVCEPVAPRSRDPVQIAAAAAEKAAMREQLADALAPDPSDSAALGGRGSPAPKRRVTSARRVGEGTLLCWSLLLRLTTRLPHGSRTRERLLEYARATKAVPRLMSAVAPTLSLEETYARITPRGSRRGSLSSLIDAPGRADSPARGEDADGAGLPPAWRELARLSRDVAASGGSGGGKAAAGASVDPLDPGLLYRRVDRLSGTSDGDGDDGEKTRVSSRRAAREAAERKSARLAVGLYHAALRALPAAVRVWFADLRDKNFARALASATASCVSPALLAAEFDAVERASKGNYGGGGLDDDDAGELTIKASRGNREVVARYDIDDACLELVVRLPASYPLGAAELDCAKRVGISEARLRKWMLTVSSILQHQNGAVAEGLMLWRSNIDREFKGVEPCPICYLVIHGTNHQTPRLVCRQCGNKFHSACLYKWFQSSSGSKCPLCQVPWGSNYR